MTKNYILYYVYICVYIYRVFVKALVKRLIFVCVYIYIYIFPTSFIIESILETAAVNTLLETRKDSFPPKKLVLHLRMKSYFKSRELNQGKLPQKMVFAVQFCFLFRKQIPFNLLGHNQQREMLLLALISPLRKVQMVHFMLASKNLQPIKGRKTSCKNYYYLSQIH